MAAVRVGLFLAIFLSLQRDTGLLVCNRCRRDQATDDWHETCMGMVVRTTSVSDAAISLSLSLPAVLAD